MTQASAARRNTAPRVPPHNLEAEESLLGAMMLSRTAIDDAAGIVRAEDFYKPNHGVLFGAITRLHGNGHPIDPVTVADELARAGQLDSVGGRATILEVQAATPASANASHYAKIVVHCSSLRKLINAADRIAEMAYDASSDPVEATDQAHELISRAEIPLGGRPSPTVSEFLSRRSSHEWAWTGCLEIMERLLIVAPEKYGKSTLIRQIAVCLSQGRDPFRPHQAAEAALVHLVDLENPEPLIRRKLGALYDACNTLEQQADPRTLRVDAKPEGLEIGNSRADEMWLLERIAANRAEWDRIAPGWPMILCIGPIYKMLDDELSQLEVKRLQRSIDRIRKRFKCAVIMETHAPHESFHAKAPAKSIRPAGPRSWLRWPEFCRAIEPSSGVAASGRDDLADFYDVQGARDERAWPRRLTRGGTFPWLAEPGV